MTKNILAFFLLSVLTFTVFGQTIEHTPNKGTLTFGEQIYTVNYAYFVKDSGNTMLILCDTTFANRQEAVAGSSIGSIEPDYLADKQVFSFYNKGNGYDPEKHFGEIEGYFSGDEVHSCKQGTVTLIQKGDGIFQIKILVKLEDKQVIKGEYLGTIETVKYTKPAIAEDISGTKTDTIFQIIEEEIYIPQDSSGHKTDTIAVEIEEIITDTLVEDKEEIPCTNGTSSFLLKGKKYEANYGYLSDDNALIFSKHNPECAEKGEKTQISILLESPKIPEGVFTYSNQSDSQFDSQKNFSEITVLTPNGILYCTKGTLKIKQKGSDYECTFDIILDGGVSFKGTFTGEIDTL